MFYPHKADPGMAFMPVAEAIVLQNSQNAVGSISRK